MSKKAFGIDIGGSKVSAALVDECGGLTGLQTVPAEMTVVGTGTLLNEDAVFSREQRDRIARARRSTGRVRIVEPGEVGTPAASAARCETLATLEVAWLCRLVAAHPGCAAVARTGEPGHPASIAAT